MMNRHSIHALTDGHTVQHKLRVLYTPISLLLVLVVLFLFVSKVNGSPSRYMSLPPYTVSLSTSNFNIQSLTAVADDLNDPQQALFSLRNGTRLWYGISLQSTPPGMQLLPAAQNGDLVTTTSLNVLPMLPPSEILPFDQGSDPHKYAQLRLKVAFSGPDQRLQLKLDPADAHALTLDICDLLLHLLGQRNTGVQVGLLSPGALKELFDTTSNLRDFTTLVNDYSQLLSAAPDESALLAHAYDCAVDLVALLADSTEQAAIADQLWKIQGKAIPRASILKVVSDFTRTQSGLAVEAYIKNLVLSYGTALLQQNNPVVLLRTANPVKPTPTHAPTPVPTPAPTRVLPVVPTTLPSPTSVPTPHPASRPVPPRDPPTTHKFKHTPTVTPTNTPEPAPTAEPAHTPIPSPSAIAAHTPIPSPTFTLQPTEPPRPMPPLLSPTVSTPSHY
jgi:hypothetical protein